MSAAYMQRAVAKTMTGETLARKVGVYRREERQERDGVRSHAEHEKALEAGVRALARGRQRNLRWEVVARLDPVRERLRGAARMAVALLGEYFTARQFIEQVELVQPMCVADLSHGGAAHLLAGLQAEGKLEVVSIKQGLYGRGMAWAGGGRV